MKNGGINIWFSFIYLVFYHISMSNFEEEMNQKKDIYCVGEEYDEIEGIDEGHFDTHSQ